MPIPNLITDLTTTAATNSPAGGESVTTADDYLRAQASFIAQLRDRVQSVALGGTGAITATAAADALGAFRRGTLLGTVSQAAGVPTGAVFETGTNANGTYTRFADGTQICSGVFPNLAVAANTSTLTTAQPFPAVFVGPTPVYAVTGTPNSSVDVYGFIYDNQNSLSSLQPVYRNGATTQTILFIRYVATGRWF